MKIGQITIDLHFNSEIGKFYVSASPEEVQQGTQFTGKVKNSTAPEALSNSTPTRMTLKRRRPN